MLIDIRRVGKSRCLPAHKEQPGNARFIELRLIGADEMAQQEGVSRANHRMGRYRAVTLARDLHKFVCTIDGVGNKRRSARRVGAGIVHDGCGFAGPRAGQDDAISGWHL
jgi:hypothetical protein